MTNELKDRISKIRSGEVPNGYVKDKLGIVPKEWEEIKFSTLIDDYSEYTDDLSQFPLYSLTIEDGITAKTERYERSHLVKKSEAYKIIKSNDFAYNPMNARFGAIARNKEPFSVVVSGYYDIFSVKNKCDIEFMDSFLVSDAMIKYYNKVSTGSLAEKQRVHFSQFIDFRFKMPSLDERKKIAEILSTQDKVIDLIQNQIEELKKLKKAYLQKMFPQKGSLYPEIRFKGFTDAWEQRQLGEVLSFLKDGTHGTHKNSDEGIYLLSAKNIKNGEIIIDETSDRKISKEEFDVIHSTFKLQRNDVLLTIVGSIGEVAILKNPDIMTFQRSVAFLRPNEELISSFLKTEIESDVFQKELSDRKSQSAQPGVYLGELGKIPFAVPLLKEQQQIGTYFRNLDTLITLHQRKLEQEQQKKKALMQLLLTGIVRVKV